MEAVFPLWTTPPPHSRTHTTPTQQAEVIIQDQGWVWKVCPALCPQIAELRQQEEKGKGSEEAELAQTGR